MYIYRACKTYGGWVEKSVMADAKKAATHLSGHMTYIQASVVFCQKNIFDLFRFTQPEENFPYHW